MNKKLLNAILWLDRFINGLLLGDKRETISSRLGRNLHIKWARWTCKILDFIIRDDKHCEKNIEDIKNRQSTDHPIAFFVVFCVLLATILHVGSWIYGLF